MSEPKKMTARRWATDPAPRCLLCKSGIAPGGLYYTTKNRGRPLRYIHASCWAEVKKVKA